MPLDHTPAISHVGMIALTDPDDPDQVSGMPHSMAKALRAQGIRITPIVVSGGPSAGRLARAYRRRAPHRFKSIMDRLRPGATSQELHARAAWLSSSVRAQLDDLTTDNARATGRCPEVLFGVCIATALADLETDIPIVYYSDATSPIINTTYPAFSARGPALLDTRIEIERRALTRVTRAAFAAPNTRDSAIHDLGINPDIARTIPMGAHVVPVDPASITAPAAAPTDLSCRLLIVAADPIRKRVDLAVEATELLNTLGIHATLSIIGPGTPRARRSPFVEHCKPLRLSHPDDAARHRALLAASHLQLLPSVGEAFGIAPTESAHFARPSIVSDAGGLPYVIRDDDTGLVIPVRAPASEWAKAIAALVRDPHRYRRYSSSALARARVDFTWSAWATRMIGLMREAAGQIQPANQPAAADPTTDQPPGPKPYRGVQSFK